ncbi:hypothetical protein [Floridanema evergladense]|uniref:Uncharacterized protein n=1 Tax=Floridaenema evergladense BLCC-F167 TaxID=3153639 RepID=A0ABV4WPT3_9CYAN
MIRSSNQLLITLITKRMIANINKVRSHHERRSHLNCQPKTNKISTTASEP